MSRKLQTNITIWSCFGKITSILIARLNAFIDVHTVLGENQAGFHAHFSTMDCVFVLHALTEIAKTQKNKMLSFIDFSKAFDSVCIWRVGLWKKLLASSI